MKLLRSLSIGFGFCLLLPAAHAGVARNDSYQTLCAEMDNINVPLYHTNTTAYRITATHPSYTPSSIFEWGADFDDCTFGGRGIWTIGADDGLYSEFLQGYGFANGDTYFAQDEPAAGVDEASGLLPREINNDWMYNQYIQFTADEDEDVNLEVRIGAKFTLKLAQVSGTLEIRALTAGTNGWTDQGTRIFNSANRTGVWNIPDLTWMEGVDTNIIHLQVVRAGAGSQTTTNAWAYYDFLELRKRDEAGDNSWTPTVLYNDTNTIVETVHIDFWWRYPEVMEVSVAGGGTDTNAHYLRIKRRTPGTTNSWGEVFVLYEDGNARIIPLPPEGMWAVPYGASIILGPTTNSPRPFAEIDQVTVDPDDLSLDIVYGQGQGSTHVELRADRTRQVVDVSDITYDTSTNAFARFRSMWVHDGKSDIDRVLCADGLFPIMDNWDALEGTWWQFFREVPSYHNTYCPDFRVEVLDSSSAFWTAEAEDASWILNAWTEPSRHNASGAATLAFSESGGAALFTDIDLAEPRGHACLLVRYSVVSGGDSIDHLANTVCAIVDGSRTSEVTWAVATGGQDRYELLPALDLGDLEAGTHTIRLICGPGTNSLEVDTLELVSQTARGWIRRPLIAMECEDFAWATNYQFESRAYGDDVIHLQHADMNQTAAASYSVFFAHALTNAYLRLRYSDDVGPNKIKVLLDDELRGKFPSETTGSWDDLRDSPMFFLGHIATGWHELKFDVSDQTWGLDLDAFEVYEMVDNRSPAIDLSGLPLFPVGMGTSFVVQISDADGNVVAIGNPEAPGGSSFASGVFAWAPGTAYAGTSNVVVFVADDQRGLTNSVVTNSAHLVVPFDWDRDGLGDGWEWDAFSALGYDGSDDPDEDGADNDNEYVAGTAAANADSSFRATTAVTTGREITVPTIPGRQYAIFFTDSELAGDVVWHSFADTNNGCGTWLETNSTPATHTFLDDEGVSTTGGAPADGRRCYRVRVSAPNP